MLPILKKSGGKTSAMQPAWHPNFRDVEHLPDTKAVRTAFFINGLAVLAALSLLMYAVFKEMKLKVLREDVADWEQVIETNKAASDSAIAAFKQFQAQEKKFKDAEALLESPLVVSDLVYHLGAMLPPEVRIGAIEYRAAGVNLSGSVRGAPERASGLVTSYLEQLRQDPILKQIFGEIELTNMSRNAAEESISMELVLKFPAPTKGKK